MNRLALVLVTAGAALLASGEPVFAQEVPQLQVGALFVTRANSIGPQAGIDWPLRPLANGFLRLQVGGGLVVNDGSWKTYVGGGLKWNRPINPKTQLFVAFLAGITWHPDLNGNTTPDFGATPAGGFAFKLSPRVDFWAMAGLALLRRAQGTAVAAQLSAGLSIPLK